MEKIHKINASRECILISDVTSIHFGRPFDFNELEVSTVHYKQAVELSNRFHGAQRGIIPEGKSEIDHSSRSIWKTRPCLEIELLSRD